MKVEAWHNDERDEVEVRISFPFSEYASSLWPNQILRERVEAALEKFLYERSFR